MIGGSGGIGGGRQRTQSVAVVAAQPVQYIPVQYIPTEEQNNLFSTSYLRILDLIGEGEVERIVPYLDNTPIQNFSGVTYETRNGTQSQTFIPGFGEVVSETAVGVVVTAAAPVVRTITAPCDSVRVTVTVPALQEYTDKNDILGASIAVRIDIQGNGGGYTTALDDVISGRTSQQYQRQYVIPLYGPFPMDIRVSRQTSDSTNSKLANAFSWASYSAITYAKLSYPNSALCGLRINAEQFSSIPERSYLVWGTKIKIPSNATVDSANGRLIFSGVWNGTFGAAQWCSDPAWCLWDLCVTRRYGFGDHLDIAMLDKWAFYSASQYNSALVPDGFGGYEPRFSCNINIQTAEDAYRLINDLCSVMRVMPYWAAGALTISQDRPSDPVLSFTSANAGTEGFTYSGPSIRARPTVAVARYQDLDTRNEGFEVYEDAEGIKKYGVIKVSIEAVACTSRGQAQRLAKWLVYTEQNAEVVSHASNLATLAIARPGMVSKVADPLRAGSRRGGMIAAATTTAITLDDATGLSTDNSPTLSVILNDGTVQARAVVAIAGNVVAVSPAFSSAPQPNSIWIYETSNIQASTWRVLAAEERDGVACSITALTHNPSKYDFIEQGLALERPDITDLDIVPDAPQNLTGVEVLYEAGSRALAKLQLSWAMVPGVSNYRVSYRRHPDNWEQRTVNAPSTEIFDTQEGRYEVLVAAAKAGIILSQPARLWFTCAGKTAPPANVTGASLLPIDGASAILSWDRAPDLDVRLGGRVLIRHSPSFDTPSWGEATTIIQSASGSQVQKQVPLLEGSYLLKFEDDGGRESTGVTYVVADLPEPQPRLLIKTYAEDQEDPPFSGNTIDMLYSSYFDALVLGTGLPFDSAEGLFDSAEGLFDSPAMFASTGGALTEQVVKQGEYEFGSTYSLGGVFDVNIRRRFVTRTLFQFDLFDSRTGLFDDAAGDFDGLSASSVDAALLVRSSATDPDLAPQWSDWRELANGIVRGWGFQFKVVAKSYDPTQNIIIDELGAVLELQQRVEQSGVLSAPASTYAVTFAERFYEAPSVGITGYNMTSGDYWAINPASITPSGFSITFRNSAGAAVARQFNYTAIGFGRGIA
jgi:hypothetical protein